MGEPQSLIEARFAAQRIAFGPIIFQAVREGKPAGLQVERVTGTLGICSSLMVCRRRSAE